MHITQITVSYGETCSLPEYSNVKPSITLTAVVEYGEDPCTVESALWDLAKESVYAKIDAALEANDRPAKYSTEPRYQVLATYRNHWREKDEPPPLPPMVIILPSDAKLDDKRLVHASHVADSRRQRLHVAQRIAAQVVGELGAVLFDCSDGDMSRLDAVLAEDAAPVQEKG